MINGKPSWTSTSSSIWLDHANNWLIGDLENIGTNLAVLFTGFGNQCPFNLQSVFWNYYDGLGWLAVPEKYLVNIDCLKN